MHSRYLFSRTALAVGLFFLLLFPPGASAQAAVPDSSKTLINWADYELTGTHCKLPPSGWFRWWYIPGLAVPAGTVVLLRNKEEAPPVSPPLITCLPDQILSWGEGLPVPNPSAISVTNYCPDGNATITHSGDRNNGGGSCADNPLIVERTYTVTDACGNTVSCVQTFTYRSDEEAPTLTCPPDVTINCSDEADPAQTGIATATDNYTPATEINIRYDDDPSGLTGCNGTGILSRTWFASDDCRNTAICTQRITVEDTSTPAFTDTPPDQTVDCGAIPPPYEVQASDDCQPDTPPELTLEETTGSGCPYTITRTWTATDACGNTNSFTQTITVTDTTAPELACPIDTYVLCGESTEPAATGLPLITDDCSDYTLTYSDDLSNLTACSGFIVRTFEVVDECGNSSSCNQTIYIVDTGCDFMPAITVNESDCGAANGQINVDLGPGFLFNWSNGTNGSVLLDVPPGTYTLTIVNSDFSCSQELPVVVPQAPPYPLFLESLSHPSGSGATDGNIVLSVTDPRAILPFTILLNGSVYGTTTTATFSVSALRAGNYEVQVFDANGCPSTVIQAELMVEPGGRRSPTGPSWHAQFEVVDFAPARSPQLPIIPPDDPAAGVEHPPVALAELSYVPDQAYSFWGGPWLGSDLLLVTGVRQLSGRVFAESQVADRTALPLDTRFAATQIFTGLRRHFGQSRFRWFTTAEVGWQHNVVENNSYPAGLLSDPAPPLSYDQVDLRVSGGVYLPINRHIGVTLEVGRTQQLSADAKARHFLATNYVYLIELE
jgi:hypothetical protein